MFRCPAATFFRGSGCPQQRLCPSEVPPETEMDFGYAGDLHILPKLFSAWPASGVFLLYNPLCNFGSTIYSSVVPSYQLCPVQWSSSGCVRKTLVLSLSAQSCCVTCPSAEPVKG